MKITIEDEENGKYEFNSEYAFLSTDSKAFIGGDIRVIELIQSVSSLLLSCYESLKKVSDFNSFDLDEFFEMLHLGVEIWQEQQKEDPNTITDVVDKSISYDVDYMELIKQLLAEKGIEFDFGVINEDNVEDFFDLPNTTFYACSDGNLPEQISGEEFKNRMMELFDDLNNDDEDDLDKY